MDQTGLPPLDFLRSFEAAARLASFTAAAAELGLTQAAVSQHVKSLETRLKVRLFRRLPRGVELTPEGAAYLPHIQSAFAAIRGSTEELFGDRAKARVLLRTPISFGALMLAPKLAAFSEALPQIRLDLETIHRPADYDAGEAALDIRYGAGAFPGRQAVRLTRERLVPVATPMLARYGDWTEAPLIALAGARAMWSEWFIAAGLPPRPALAHRFDSFIAAFEAARSGVGVLLGSRPLIDRALGDGTLLRLCDFELAGDAGHFLTRPAGGRPAAAERQVWDWLRETAWGGEGS